MKFNQFHKSKYLCIKSDSYMDYFFEHKKKPEDNFNQKVLFRSGTQTERETHSRMRKKEMMKSAMSTVHVQQLFVVVYDEEAFQWDQSSAWCWHFFSFFQS